MKNIPIDFNAKAVSAKNKELDESLAENLANALQTQRKDVKARKAVGWGKALLNDGKLLLDDADYKDLYAFIEGNEMFAPFYEVQLLDVMDAAKEAANKAE